MPKFTWLETHWLSGTVMVLCLSTVKHTSENNYFFLICLPQSSATAPVVKHRMFVYALVKIHCIYIYVHAQTFNIRGSVPTKEVRCLKVSFHNTSSSLEGNRAPNKAAPLLPAQRGWPSPSTIAALQQAAKQGAVPCPHSENAAA